MSKVTPYNSSESKKKQVSEMFDNIANSYDFLNHSLSLGMDNVWRKIAIKKLTNNPKIILDIATGTGDFAVSAAKYTDAKITGIDISQGMLNVGIEKVRKKNLNNRISLQLADSESLPFNDNTFDAITAGFGVRNFENLPKGLREMNRVIKPDAKAVILEFSKPTLFHDFPPSIDLYRPSPYATERWLLFSPEPTQITLVLFGSIVIQPIEYEP
mgnify:CR=1 FL=1